MISRPSGLRWLDPFEAELGEIEPIDERVDRPNWIILVDPVFQTFRKQRALAAIYSLDEALHPIPPQIAMESYLTSHVRWDVFTRPGSTAAIRPSLAIVRFPFSIGSSRRRSRLRLGASSRTSKGRSQHTGGGKRRLSIECP